MVYMLSQEPSMKGGSYLWLILMFFIAVYLSFELMVELVVAGCWFTILQKKHLRS